MNRLTGKRIAILLAELGEPFIEHG